MVDPQRMAKIAARFDPPAEVIADYRGVHSQSDLVASRENVLEMIRLRPCTLDDIAEGLGLHRNEVAKYIEQLRAEGRIEKRSSAGRVFYCGKQS